MNHFLRTSSNLLGDARDKPTPDVKYIFTPTHHVAVCTVAPPLFGAEINIHFMSDLIASFKGFLCNFVGREDVVPRQREVSRYLQQLIA